MIFVYVLTSIVINSKKKDEPEEEKQLKLTIKMIKMKLK